MDQSRPNHPFFKDYSLLLVGQPIRSSVDPTAEITFVEVLLRVSAGSLEKGLEHWKTRLIPTDPFIEQMLCNPTASIALDIWVAERVCQLDNPERYSINITHHSCESIDFLRFCNHAFAKFKIEITERRPITDQALEIIKELSIRQEIYMDDFGQGHANLESLLRLQPYLTGVKIDGTLMADLSNATPMRRSMLGGTLAMIYRLHESGEKPLHCVAEMVETPSDMEELLVIRAAFSPLLKLFCQGWSVGKPRLLPFPVEHFEPSLI